MNVWRNFFTRLSHPRSCSCFRLLKNKKESATFVQLFSPLLCHFYEPEYKQLLVKANCNLQRRREIRNIPFFVYVVCSRPQSIFYVDSYLQSSDSWLIFHYLYEYKDWGTCRWISSGMSNWGPCSGMFKSSNGFIPKSCWSMSLSGAL